jgi:hypothetical protein
MQPPPPLCWMAYEIFSVLTGACVGSVGGRAPAEVVRLPLRNAELQGGQHDKSIARGIRDLLIGFAAAIELDQVRIDALPPEKFHPGCDDRMWRRWRRKHLEYIDRLLTTTNEILSTRLKELSQVAVAYEPAVVGQIALELFADAASGGRQEEELETAGLFFGWLIRDVCGRPRAKSTESDATRCAFRKIRNAAMASPVVS